MQWLAELCVKRPIFASVLSLVILVVGGAFYTQLGVDQFPKIDFPAVTIVTRLPGASPADVETEISDKIEGAVNTISGIDELRSVSSEGVSQVIVTFVLEKEVNVAAQEVREKVSAVLPELPKGVEQPVINKIDPDAQPVLYVALLGKGKEVRDITDGLDAVGKTRARMTFLPASVRTCTTVPGANEGSCSCGTKKRAFTFSGGRISTTGVPAATISPSRKKVSVTRPPAGAVCVF